MIIGLNFNIPGVSFYGFKPLFKKLVKNESFWSFNFILLIVLSHYCVRATREETKKIFSILIVFFKILNLLLVYVLNYVHPVKLPRPGADVKHVVPFLLYWSIIVLHLFENLYLFVSNSLDVMENILPLGRSDTDRLVIAVLYVVLGANITFHLRSVSFFWPKIFHGHKDYFSDISSLDNIPTDN